MLTQADAGKTFIAKEAEKRGSLPAADYYALWKVLRWFADHPSSRRCSHCHDPVINGGYPVVPER